MSLTTEQQATAAVHGTDENCYVITLSTWITDRKAAIDLAVQITESLAASNDQIDQFGTTIGIEDDDVHGQERIYEEIDV
jgi:hypothetical protein